MLRLLYKESSSSEHATLYQLRNVINRRNVVKDPMKDFNACDDFFMNVLTSHITAAAMKYMQIESLAEVPSENVLPHADNMWAYQRMTGEP